MDGSWPPPYNPPATDYPPRRWPSLDQLSYAEKAITVGLLVLALPWLVRKLFAAPAELVKGLGHPVGRAAGG